MRERDEGNVPKKDDRTFVSRRRVSSSDRDTTSGARGASLAADDVALVARCDLHRSTLRRSRGPGEGEAAYGV